MKLNSIATSTLLFLLFFTQPSSQQDDLQCLSLADSSACPAYQKYYVSLYYINSRYPTLNNITDVESFDSELLKYVTSPAFYSSPLGCDNKADVSNIPYARYSLSYMCANLIQNTEFSLPCNYKYDLSPLPLCQETCYQWINDIESVTHSPKVCPNQPGRQSGLDELNATCRDWSGLNGTSSCIVGYANEPTCGFGNKQVACSFCKSHKDACCETLSGCSNLSAGGIVGIVFGCMIFLTCLAGTLFLIWKKKRSRQNGTASFKSLNNNPKGPEFHDSVSALGYESFASQRALVQPPQPITSTTFENHSYHSVSSPTTTHLDRIQNLPPPVNTMLHPPPPLPEPEIEEFYEVKHPYPAQLEDELGLNVGDIVCVAMNFDDGWALGFNVNTGQKGVFPLVCVSLASEELLEQLLLTTEQIYSTKTLVEENDQMQQLCENIRRSISISSRRAQPADNNNNSTNNNTTHTEYSNSIPRRTASMRNNGHNYGYPEIDSPTSPSLSTPFFEVGLLQNTDELSQPEPALVQPVETYEMYRKPHNRVSKLEAPE